MVISFVVIRVERWFLGEEVVEHSSLQVEAVEYFSWAQIFVVALLPIKNIIPDKLLIF
mgnify:CR=1 FL=1